MLSVSMSFSLLAFVIISSIVRSGNSQTSHSDMYLDIQVPDSSLILRKIGSIPLKFYEFKFDSIAGRQQMGFFGAEVMSTFPESVEIAPKYVLPNRDKSKPATVLFDYPLVDKSVVFMHSIAAIQELQKCYRILSDAIDSCASEELIIFRAIETMLARVGGNGSWLPSSHLKVLNEISVSQRDLADVLIERSLAVSRKRRDHADHKRNLRDSIRLLHHHRAGNSSADTLSKLEDMSVSKVQYLSDMKDEALRKKHEEDVGQLDFEFNDNIGQYADSIEQVSHLVQYRIRMQQEAQDEEHDIAMMRARDEVMRKEIKFVIDVFFAEVTTMLSKMDVSPSLLLFRGFIGLLLCLALLVAYEVGKVLKLFIFKRVFALPDLSARAIIRRGNNSKDGNSLRDLVHGGNTMRSLEAFSLTLSNSIRNKLPLPNLLLFGQAGTGKTLSASTIAFASGASTITVTWSELLSKGTQAGSSFRLLLDNAKKNGNSPVIVVLDDADAIIRSRDTDRGDSSSSSVHSCFYLLLESIRDSNPSVAIIVTTSSDHISSIDSALLDRLDAVIELSLPETEQRLTFIARRTLDLLSPFVTGETKIVLESCLPYMYLPHRGVSPTEEQLMARERAVRGHLDSIALIDHRSFSIPADDAQFDVALCVYALVACSRRWSLKEVAKWLANVRSEVLGTDRCTLTSHIWMREIGRKMREITVS